MTTDRDDLPTVEHRVTLADLPLKLIVNTMLRRVHKGWVLGWFNFDRQHTVDGDTRWAFELTYVDLTGHPYLGSYDMASAADRVSLLKLGLVPNTFPTTTKGA
jgi:hypothetical protein